MKRLARQAIKRAQQSLKIALQPKSKETPQEADDAHVTHLLHSVKDDMDAATQEINGTTSTEQTEHHQEAEKMSDKLLNDYFHNGDIESIRALASGLIAQLSPTQAREHLQGFVEHYNEFVKGDDE